MSDREVHHHHGGATALVAGAGIGAWLVLRDQKKARHPSAVPKPAPVHTEIVHSVTHTVTRVVAAHFPLSGTEIVIIAALAIVAGLVFAINVIGRLT